MAEVDLKFENEKLRAAIEEKTIPETTSKDITTLDKERAMTVAEIQLLRLKFCEEVGGGELGIEKVEHEVTKAKPELSEWVFKCEKEKHEEA